MAKTFAQSEKDLESLFEVEKTFNYQDRIHTIQITGKPSPASGECKTDLYIRTIDEIGEQHEFKLSIKQNNADFIENKISAERAVQIFGDDATTIIKDAIQQIESQFTDEPLITFIKFGRTEAKTIKIGWKFELLNKKSGCKSAIINLTQQQVLDVYSGTNLSDDKKNSKVNSITINGSGVANTILFMDPSDSSKSLQDYVDDIQSIEDYCQNQEVYFACKAINYRATPNKWDGDRPLSVWVEWGVENNELSGTLKFDSPLEQKANSIGNHIQRILNQHQITKDNFDDLQDILNPNTRVHK